jgi:hypothetical protein
MSTPHRATTGQWLVLERQAETLGCASSRALLELRARIEALEAGATCPHIVSSDEGTSYCRLAEQTQDKLDRLIALDRDDPTPDAPMTELRAASAEVRPAGGLVERVEEAIITGMVDGDRHAARAAIGEVAAWLRSEYPRRSGLGIAWANLIEQEADRG